ncbi:transient receptor potential cation channel subfamily V member 6 [Patella vulgata]|uniref:transient receptor potential cation channel subfamily V member 6 n=1 Tax=Patella vulgata TaxID=6465 RepID=UPI0021809767|nr:transient receptor potential cation channel subfamily V member 6 [Patella vulgata]
MGNKINRRHHYDNDPDSAWKAQNKAVKDNPIYKFVSIDKTGRLITEYKEEGRDKVIETIRKEIEPYYLYKNGGSSTITKLEYVKWFNKAEGKTDLKEKSISNSISKITNDQLNTFELDKYSSFTQHDACWILDKRGAVGETPFHLCYLMGTPEHSEVAKIFLSLYPKMSLDIYEGREYYGESCLHIAVVYGDIDAVKMLVANGADVNQRATGQFFLPEDVKAGKNANQTNYEGYAYYGEYPLAFAACLNHQEIYDYLIDHGADPNKQDSFGNTVLHMVVIANQPRMYKYAVQHHKKKAKTEIQNKANLTPLTLASKLGRHQIFLEMLELNSIDMWKYSNITCSMYPIQALDSIGPYGRANWNSALMIIVDGKTDEHLDMLQGGVMRQLLDEKWKTFARSRFLLRLLIAFIHLALISVAIYTRPSRMSLLIISGSKDIVRVVAEIFTCILCIASIAVEVKEIGALGVSSFFKNCKHAVDQTIYLISCLLILFCVPFRVFKLHDVEDTLLTIAVPGAFFYLLFFARGMRTTGPFVTMVYQMCTQDLIRFGIVYLIFLLGFTQGFYFLFRDVNADSTEVLKFSTPWETVLNLFQMTLGEFKYETFNYARYVGLTKFIFTLFMILVPILLLNMLIAMMGNTYHNINTKSEKEWRRQWAKIVVVLERGFTKKQLLKFQEEYSIGLTTDSKTDDGGNSRALVVIKAANKSSAKQSKAAKSNWRRVTKSILNVLCIYFSESNEIHPNRVKTTQTEGKQETFPCEEIS